MLEALLTSSAPTDALVALQVFVVAFIAFHDWVPLGALNDVKAVQAADSRARLVAVTLLSTLPFAIGLAGTVRYGLTRLPGWLNWYLWITYGAATYGMFRAWWGPYLLYEDPVRAARYEAMFGRTLAFLPTHNGIRPNALHLALHLCIIAILAILGDLQLERGG